MFQQSQKGEVYNLIYENLVNEGLATLHMLTLGRKLKLYEVFFINLQKGNGGIPS